ncbi:MAG TPA: hypothetical protein VF787_27990 [Thermoanaerobaculia bacterium]
MKRLLAAALVLLVPGVALAFDTTRRAQPDTVRIAILSSDADGSGEDRMVRTKVVNYLQRELRSRGFDAYETEWTYDDAANAENVDVDYYVEMIGAGADSNAVGGVDIAGRNTEVSIGVVTSLVGAELRLYDARTMELLTTQSISKRTSAIRPTGIGLGGADVFAWIAIPFFERRQMSSAAKATAHEAAVLIVDAVK